MKDIDFDELDRAVSSVLEPTAGTDPAPDEKKTDAAPAEKTDDATVSVTSTPPAPEAPVIETPEPAAVSAEADTPAASPAAPRASLAIKRRGQFMDVVHPSSDMTKPEDAKTVPPRKITLTPLSDSVEPETKPEAEVTPETEAPVAPADTPAVETTPEVQDSADSSAPFSLDATMPDPLDVMQQQEEAKDAEAAEVAPSTASSEDMPTAADEIAPAESSEPETPATPFLSDTKVEKRPLDAFSAEEPATAEAEDAEVSDVPADGTAQTEQVPPELQADVVAVESGQPEQAEKEAEAEKEPEQEQKKEEASDTGFAASIPQQYTAADTKADDEHAIFDTREYHQPLTPPAKKKRGLPGWIVALVVMILLAALSAAGGYFWFYYGL